MGQIWSLMTTDLVHKANIALVDVISHIVANIVDTRG